MGISIAREKQHQSCRSTGALFGSAGRRGAIKRFFLIADITTLFGPSSYEISVFNGNGTFLGTFPILENIQSLSTAGQARQNNLDGADFRVTIGPVRSLEY
ncbi:MAG: hypothetical protein ACI9MF_000701 [Gammaproteobacteria bacterium]|jgi:hypothetical protein